MRKHRNAWLGRAEGLRYGWTGGLRGGTLAAAFVLCTMFVLVAHSEARQQPPRTAAQEEFVPIDQLPPEDRLPAAPLLIAAYAIAWVAILAYVWSLWRRLGQVEREMTALSRRVGTESPPGARK